MDDWELVARARAKDEAAFTELVRRYDRFLLSLVAWHVGARDARDAAQVIWLAVYQKLWQLEQGDKFRPWLRKLAFYQCINYRKRRRRFAERETTLSVDGWVGLADFMADPAEPLDELLIQRDVRRAVSRELDRLPGEYGLLLRLRYFRDLSYEEVAAVAGLPLSTVRWRLHQGKKLLKGRLASILHGGRDHNHD